MLESTFKFDTKAEKDTEPYNLHLPRDNDWRSHTKRVLVIMQTVDSRDLKAKCVLGDKATNLAFKNAIKHTRSIVRTYDESKANAGYAVVNFNQHKHFHLSASARKAVEVDFAKRVHRIIQDLKPTHVLVSGDDAMRALFPQVQDSNYKRGWVHELKSDDHKIKVTSTLDFARLLEKDGLHANLLGFWCRHLCNLLLGKDPHSLANIKAEPVYVDSIEKFDLLMRRLRRSATIAVDTETRDLSVLFNAIYTIQFTTDLDPLKGYVLPLKHPMTPWTRDELKYILKELRKFFSEGQDGGGQQKELIFMNGMFDLRVIRRQLKLAIIWHKAWEVTSGEHSLDENIVELAGFGAKPGNLAAIYCSYGNDHYLQKSAFMKADRATTGNVKPNNKDFLMYAATDTVSIFHIRQAQIDKAGHQFIDGHVYRPFFHRHMLCQMSDTAHQLSHLREDGSLVDAKYLRYLTSSESPLRTEMRTLNRAFRVFPQAVEANRRIIGSAGIRSKGLFGAKRTEALNWGLSLSKPSHLRTLFFDVMGLEPLSETKGGQPSVDKEMVAQYKDKNQIVDAYGEYSKLSKLLSTYARGWYKKMRSNKDSVADGHLRPDYSSFDVTTGRLASKNPSLQTIPSRGKLVKIIKRMFIAPKGALLVRYDYSAHEVRVWSYVGLDRVLADIFRVGQKLRQKFIKDPTDENKKAIKLKGDIHILNVKRLLNKDVDKEHPLRDAIKAIIFGLLYGKSAETLGEDTKLGDKMALMSVIGNKDTPEKEVLEAEKKLRKLLAEDRTPYAQGLIDKIFQEFKAGGKWTNRMKKFAEEHYYVYSPTGRKRNLFAAMTGDRKIVSQQVRRGSNAPIQGLASEIGVKAGRRIMESYYRELPNICKLLDIEYSAWGLRVPYNRMVHDASYYSVPFAMVIPFIHILQWDATYGITKAYKEEFGFEFSVEPEIEIEIGVRDDSMSKWDWSLPNIVEAVIKSIDQAEEFDLLDGRDKQEVIREIFRPWANKKMRTMLQSKYPLLNVKNLDKQIVDAIRPIYIHKTKETKCKKTDSSAVVT